ncbi:MULTISPECIES: hypothetical protein [Burkholderia cepacia complex]|uniref:hypothetical protein n=1 Tax=Burkholderia cepacia complex TaxID=87882 RepID=UPI00190587DF|nr:MULTISPECIES: hypothetical protein [Burkholderia cepacia complex]MBJ9727534.1 hypothetical protein [Burkholderia cenocepacia]MDN7533662.1 hypothetical protein [Burkholderia orbicola]
MEIISSKVAQETVRILKQGVTVNETIGQFFALMGEALNGTMYKAMGVSATVTADSDAIAIKTPHDDVVGFAEHVMSDGQIAGQVTFYTVRTSAVGERTATEIMTVSLLGRGLIAAINGEEVNEHFGHEDDDGDVIKEVALILLTRVQDNLQTSEPTIFSL